MKIPENIRVSCDLIKALRDVVDGKPRRIQDLALKINTTEHFLTKIVHILGNHSLVSTVRGPGGGVIAAFNSTNMLEICQAFGYFCKDQLLIPGTEESISIEVKLRDFLLGIEI
jgi:DNA-binding IscR family transcriptional regulator